MLFIFSLGPCRALSVSNSGIIKKILKISSDIGGERRRSTEGQYWGGGGKTVTIISIPVAIAISKGTIYQEDSN